MIAALAPTGGFDLGELVYSSWCSTDMKYPDLLVSFDVDLAVYRETNGYVIAEQKRPPDLALEIGSPATGHIDVEENREFYQGLRIAEYWRFDATGEFHGASRAGDRLVGGRYERIPIDELGEDVFQGYSPMLNLLRWDRGGLALYGPASGRHIVTYEDLLAGVGRGRVRADAAEARVRELERELRRLPGHFT